MKPIEIDTLIKTIRQIGLNLYNDRLAKEFTRKQLEEQAKSIEQDIFETVLGVLPKPIIIYRKAKSIYMNTGFTALFTNELLQTITHDETALSRLFESDINKSARVTLTLPNGRKAIFGVETRQTTVQGQETTIYVFDNITMSEYRRIKLENYADFLYEVLKTVNTSHAASPHTDTDTHRVTDFSLTNLVSAEEMDALTRHRNDHISAAEYIADLLPDVLQELDELKDLEIEIEDIFYTIECGGALLPNLELLGTKLLSYAHTIGRMIDFEDLALAIKNFALFLQQLQTIESPDLARLKIYTDNIFVDLKNWYQTIFVTKNTSNIHYLDGSLLSSCLQAELECNKKSTTQFQDLGDLELF